MLSLYKEDANKWSEGSPCYVIDMTFLVMRIGTAEFARQIEDIKERLYGLFPKPSDIDENEVMANWLAHHGCVGWENVIDDSKEKDEKLEYSIANSIQLFLNKEYWLSLNQVLISHATKFENYLHDAVYEEVEAIKKR